MRMNTWGLSTSRAGGAEAARFQPALVESELAVNSWPGSSGACLFDGRSQPKYSRAVEGLEEMIQEGVEALAER